MNSPPQAAHVEPAPLDVAATNAVVPAPLAKPYYIEFRARSAHNYGHTFSIYGRLDARGNIASKTVAGLHPATESPVPWMIGHLVPVPSETGASDGDTEDQYVIARFRVALTGEEYKRVIGFIKSLQAKSPVWHALVYNCNAFVGDIAKFMGMEAPPWVLMPAAYINALRDANLRKTGLVGTPVQVVSPEALRAQALKSVARAPTPGISGGATAAPKPAKPAQRPSIIKEPELRSISHNAH